MFNTDKVAMASKLEILSKKMEEILKSCTISYVKKKKTDLQGNLSIPLGASKNA